jgi:hypothetical protein
LGFKLFVLLSNGPFTGETPTQQEKKCVFATGHGSLPMTDDYARIAKFLLPDSMHQARLPTQNQTKFLDSKSVAIITFSFA